MPANAKYLTANKWQRFLKISAGILGGYLVSVSVHLALAAWFDRSVVIMTSAFSAFILWAALIVVAFLAKSGWKIWGLYLFISIVFLFIFYVGKNGMAL